VVTKESQRADHAIIEICVTYTTNESSPGIYTLGDGQDEGPKKRRKTRKIVEKRSTTRNPQS